MASDRMSCHIIRGAESDMFGVIHRSIQQFRDVVVVQGIRHVPTVSTRSDQTHGTQHAQLLGHGGLAEVYSYRQLCNCQWAFAQPGQY